MAKVWTVAEIKYLQQNASTIPSRELAAMFRVSHKALLGTLKRYGIKTGRDTRFSSGHTPWNKGATIRLSPASEFKKGNLPHNTKADGAITIRRDKGGRPYKFIRLAKGKWDLYHRVLWKRTYGDIPPNMIVTFIDGDSLNCELENLQLISRAENMARTGHSKEAREKARASLKEIWHTERLRRDYGLPAKTGFGRLINSK